MIPRVRAESHCIDYIETKDVLFEFHQDSKDQIQHDAHHLLLQEYNESKDATNEIHDFVEQHIPMHLFVVLVESLKSQALKSVSRRIDKLRLGLKMHTYLPP